MSEESRHIWAFRLDKFCAISGGLIPVGIVMGNIGFESIIGLVGLCWIISSIVAKENPSRRIIKHPLVIPFSSTGLFGLVAFSWLFINSVRLVMKNTNGFRVGLISCPVVLFVIGIAGFIISTIAGIRRFWPI